MKLISMADYVLKQAGILKEEGMYTKDLQSHTFHKYVTYANFLKTPLELGMFVPCDEDGNVLKEPKGFHDYMEGVRMGLSFKGSYNETKEQYQQAKERVIFEGAEMDSLNIIMHGDKFVTTKFRIEVAEETIEDMINHNLTLTPAKAKELNL